MNKLILDENAEQARDSIINKNILPVKFDEYSNLKG